MPRRARSRNRPAWVARLPILSRCQSCKALGSELSALCRAPRAPIVFAAGPTRSACGRPIARDYRLRWALSHGADGRRSRECDLTAARDNIREHAMASLFAFLHHVAAFTLFAALVLELILIRDDLTVGTARRLQVADMVFGISAGVLIVVGLLRVLYFEKGATYYFHTWTFIAK